MTRENVFEKLRDIFADVFDRDDIALTDATTAADIEEWDSLMHITLIGTIEAEFGIKFQMKDIVGMKNVGALADRILELAK